MPHAQHMHMNAYLRMRGAMVAALEAVCAAGEREEKRLLGLRQYPPASTPGQPPARRTGLLRDEIDHKVDRQRMIGRIGILGGAGAPGYYLRFLEKGTEKMAPRPSLRPMLATLSRKLIPEMKTRLAPLK